MKTEQTVSTNVADSGKISQPANTNNSRDSQTVNSGTFKFAYNPDGKNKN